MLLLLFLKILKLLFMKMTYIFCYDVYIIIITNHIIMIHIIIHIIIIIINSMSIINIIINIVVLLL